MTFTEIVEAVGKAVDAAGVAVIALGIIVAAGMTLFGEAADGEERYRRLRRRVGRAILLGLELLVGADIIRTVAVEPSLDNVAVLAGIVAIRTFLSFSLEVELTGRWPWQPEAATPEP